jgi:16S rRNA (adenine1518-N6/adenine1519-N6)-dimethyltransferase
MVQPKKHLGQHFLTDLSIAEKVACLLDKSSAGRIIEVGCGKGVLSDFLLPKFQSDLLCIDIDDESIAYMHEKYPECLDQFVLGDILAYEFDLGKKDYAIIGNYPYNISSQIVFKVLDNWTNVKYFTGMFQKEVAERLCAKEGSKTYGILSVLLNTFYDTEYCFSIKPGSFFPAPKVMSGVIHAVRKENFELPVPYKFYKAVIKTAFGQRRKILRNSLSSLGIEQIIDKSYFTMRPEQLSFAKFIELSELLYLVQNGNRGN